MNKRLNHARKITHIWPYRCASRFSVPSKHYILSLVLLIASVLWSIYKYYAFDLLSQVICVNSILKKNTYQHSVHHNWQLPMATLRLKLKDLPYIPTLLKVKCECFPKDNCINLFDLLLWPNHQLKMWSTEWNRLEVSVFFFLEWSIDSIDK